MNGFGYRFLATALLAIPVSASTFACTCEWPRFGLSGIPDEIERSDLVFTGTVESVDTVWLLPPQGNDKLFRDGAAQPEWTALRLRYSFRPTLMVKGAADTGRIRIVTGFGGGNCGFRFEPGKSYHVFASRIVNMVVEEAASIRNPKLRQSKAAANDTSFETSICDATSAFSAEAQAILEHAGKGFQLQKKLK